MAYIDPSQLQGFGVDQLPEDQNFTQLGSLSDFYRPSSIGNFGDFRGDPQAQQAYMQQLADMYAQNSGFDPSGTYGRGTIGTGNGSINALYQLNGNQWNPIYGNFERNDNTALGALGKVLQGAGFLAGGASLLGGLGGGTLGGTGISASTPGAATGSGLGATLGSGTTLAAPTGTGMGLSAGGASLGGGLGSSLFGLDSEYNLSGGGNREFAANYGLDSAPDFGSTFGNSGGEGLNASDFSLGDGYSGVFDALTSPGITDIGSFSPNLANFASDIGGDLTSGSSLLDEVKKRLVNKATSPKGLLDIARRGLGTYQQFKNANAARRAAGGLQGQINSLQDMFGPNSAYAQQLRQQLERRDAAAGRRSQYGPREVELQAALAGQNSRMTPALAGMYNQQAQLNAQAGNARSQATNTLLGAIGEPVFGALEGMGKKTLLDLFGG